MTGGRGGAIEAMVFRKGGSEGLSETETEDEDVDGGIRAGGSGGWSLQTWGGERQEEKKKGILKRHSGKKGGGKTLTVLLSFSREGGEDGKGKDAS